MTATPFIHDHLKVCVQSEVFEVVNEWTWLKRTGLLEVVEGCGYASIVI